MLVLFLYTDSYGVTDILGKSRAEKLSSFLAEIAWQSRTYVCMMELSLGKKLSIMPITDTHIEAIPITTDTYIVLHPEASYDLEVRRQQADTSYTIGKMNYKYHHDTFASFVFKIFPEITLLDIHNLQKAINHYIP